MARRTQQFDDSGLLDVNLGDYSAISQLLAQRRNQPIYSVGQGIAQLAGDLGGAYFERQARDKAKTEATEKYKALADAIGTANQAGNTAQGPPMSGQMAGMAAFDQLRAQSPDLAVQYGPQIMEMARTLEPPKAPQPWQMQEGPRGAQIAVNPMTGEPKQIVGPDNGMSFDQRMMIEQLRRGNQPQPVRPPANMRMIAGSDPGAPEFEPIPGSKLALETEDRERKRSAALAGDKAVVRGVTQAADKTIAAIDDLLADPGLSSITGAMDARLPNVMPAANRAQGKLNNIKAQGFLETLNAMRTASATGSTGMGALSEKEGAILQNAMAALDQATTDEEYRRQLGIVRNTLAQSKNNVRLKYRDEYGQDFDPSKEEGLPGMQQPQAAQPQTQGNPYSSMSDEDILKALREQGVR